MPICPQGHETTNGAFCDTCGRPLAATPPIPAHSVTWARANPAGDLPAYPPANGQPPFPANGPHPPEPPRSGAPLNSPTAIPGLPLRQPPKPQPPLTAYPLNLPPQPTDAGTPPVGGYRGFAPDSTASALDLPPLPTRGAHQSGNPRNAAPFAASPLDIPTPPATPTAADQRPPFTPPTAGNSTFDPD